MCRYRTALFLTGFHLCLIRIKRARRDWIHFKHREGRSVFSCVLFGLCLSFRYTWFMTDVFCYSFTKPTRPTLVVDRCVCFVSFVCLFVCLFCFVFCFVFFVCLFVFVFLCGGFGTTRWGKFLGYLVMGHQQIIYQYSRNHTSIMRLCILGIQRGSALINICSNSAALHR